VFTISSFVSLEISLLSFGVVEIGAAEMLLFCLGLTEPTIDSFSAIDI
jgi:hypothetical protein